MSTLIHEKDLLFHVVVVGGTTAPFFEHFFPSLLRYSEARFHLVANGCNDMEITSLRRFECDRVQVEVASKHRILDHGEVLTSLFRAHSGEYFAFLDSDIFAQGCFLSPALTALSEADAVFSCLPVWIDPQDQILEDFIQYTGGNHTHLPTGECIGCTYFAIYRRRQVEEILDEAGITLSRIIWQDLPGGLAKRLSDLGWEKAIYDTGKLVNLLMVARGRKLRCERLPNLWHIGGLSDSAKVTAERAGILRRAWRAWAPRLLRQVRFSIRFRRLISRRETGIIAERTRRRDLACQYTAEVIKALVESRQIPRGRVGDPDLEAQFDELALALENLYAGEVGERVAR